MKELLKKFLQKLTRENLSNTCQLGWKAFYFDNLHFRSLIHFHIVCFHNFRTINLDYNFSMILFRHYTPQLYTIEYFL